MDPGYASSLGATMARMFIAALILAAIAGAGVVKGCDYVRSHYTVKVEKKT